MIQIDTDETITDKILEKALADTQELAKDSSLSVVEKKVIEVQYYLLLFIISDKRKDKNKRDSWIKWWDRLQWVIIPMVISGFVIFLWQALYFYFVVVPDFVKLPK